MYYHENIFNKRRPKKNSPPAIFPRLLSMLFTARTAHAKPLKQHSKKKKNNTKTRHIDDKENLNNNEISSSHNQKFPVSTMKIRAQKRKGKRTASFQSIHNANGILLTSSRRITAGEGEGEGAQAAQICYQKNPGRKKKKRQTKGQKAGKTKHNPKRKSERQNPERCSTHL
jgi:hypothetical protein